MPTANAISAMPPDGRIAANIAIGIAKKAKPGPRIKYKKPSKWSSHHFICFDGEGYDINGRHEYVYLAAYDSVDIHSIKNANGLTTEQCFNFMIEVAATDKQAICVIYGGSYDANMMLKDLPFQSLKTLHKTGKVRWNGWHLRYAQRKYLQIHHIDSKRTCQLWDVIGFFQATFQYSLEQWLGVNDSVIAAGKKSRGSFTARRLDSFIIPYCNTELTYFYDLMQALWVALDNAGFKLSRWDGAGSIASYLFHSRGMIDFKGSEEAQAEHYDKARGAYAGGRFELCRPGDFRETVYNYDINSAYPYAITQLPPFQDLVHQPDNDGTNISDYDLVYIDYDNSASITKHLTQGIPAMLGDVQTQSKPGPIHPFYNRSKNHLVCYPPQCKRWCWGIEVNTARRCGYTVNVTDVYHWVDNGERPWSWVGDLYNHRKELKAKGDNAERAIKLGINSLYGKMVQQKGWHEGDDIPRTHQLYWGGWVTAKTRSMLFEAMCIDPDSVIAVETDGIYTTTELPLNVGSELGQWDKTVYSDFTYCQSGMYFGTPVGGKAVAKYRGLDKGTLTREKVIAAYEAYEKDKSTRLRIKARSTRFRTIGTSLVSPERMEKWRQWTKENKTITLEPTTGESGAGKRMHHHWCKEPYGMGHSHHTVPRAATDIVSSPYNVLWIDTADKQAYFLELDEEREGITVGI